MSTTIHDLKDIMGIYQDCSDYKVIFWNFTDQKFMTLSFHYIDRQYGSSIRFVLTADDAKVKPMSMFSHVLGWSNILRRFDDHTKEWDDAQVIVINRVNNKNMKITFCGSSNSEKTVNYLIDYVDPNYHKWKRKLWMTLLSLKYRINKFFNIC